jgi:hypothetical protein
MFKQKWLLSILFVINFISAKTVHFAALIPGNTWVYSIDSSYSVFNQYSNYSSHGTLTISIIDTISQNNVTLIHSKLIKKNAHYGYRGDMTCSCYRPDTIYMDTTFDIVDTLVMGALSDTLSILYPFWNPLRIPSDSCFAIDSLLVYYKSNSTSGNGSLYTFVNKYVQSYGLVSSVHSRTNTSGIRSSPSTSDATALLSFTGNVPPVRNLNNKKSENGRVNFSWQPSISRLNISFKGTTEDIWNVDIIDLQGRQIWHNQNRIVTNSELIIHPLHLSQSIYFFRIYCKKGISVYRIALQ